MNADGFLDNLGIFADVPGGIQRLRDLVLNLAVEGRLVPQNATEKPVVKRLTEIRAEKGSTLASSIRGGAAVRREPNESERIGFLPTGWHWARIDDTGEYVNGLAFDQNDWKPSGTPIIRIQNLTNPNIPFNYAEGPFPENRLVKNGDVLVSWSATLDAFIWERGKAVLNQHIFKVVPDHRVVTTPFLFHLLRYGIRALAESEAAHGLAMQHINRGPFLSYVVRLPPLAEQERIVTKLDELMELCSELEDSREKQHHVAARFRQSALKALAEAENFDDVKQGWERLTANWTRVTDHPDSIDDLRNTVVQLGVEGRLVAQDPNETPAKTDLLAVMAAKAVVTEGSRRQPSLPPMQKSQQPSLPDGWIWVRVDDVFLVSGGIQKSPKRRPRENHYPYLRVANVQRGRLDLRAIERFELFEGELERLRLLPGDLLVVEGNGSETEIGRCARWNGEIEECVHQNHLIRCRPILPGLEHYLLLFLNSPAGMSTMKKLAVTTSGLYNLSVAKIRTIAFPMPPMAEQARIREKVDGLIQNCDSLESKLAKRQAVAKKLAESMLRAV